MPSEADRWKKGALRNTVGHTEGASGPVTGGVEGHVKTGADWQGPDTAGPIKTPGGHKAAGPTDEERRKLDSASFGGG